jgi:acyl carrier protein
MDIKSQVIDILSSELGVEKDKIKPESKIAEDLGADSLDTVELVQVFEEKFKIDIPNEDVPKMRTVDEVISYINSRIK